jgi:hypothetical protein
MKKSTVKAPKSVLGPDKPMRDNYDFTNGVRLTTTAKYQRWLEAGARAEAAARKSPRKKCS